MGKVINGNYVACLMVTLALQPWVAEGQDGVAFEAQAIGTDFSGASSVTTVDFDGDGHLDILATAATSGTVSWFRNPAQLGAAWNQSVIVTGFLGASSAIAVDQDGDGDLDIVASAFDADYVSWFENVNGDGSTWLQDTVSATVDGPLWLQSADIDGDGDLDVVSASFFDNDIIWWENRLGEPVEPPEEPTPAQDTPVTPTPVPLPAGWTGHNISSNFAGLRQIQMVDFDGDGDADVIGVGRYANGIGWYENLGNVDGEGIEWSGRRIVAEDFFYAEGLSLADIDHDGDVDVLGTSRVARDVTWFENTDGTARVWDAHKVDGKYDNASSVNAGDFDGDGAIDVVAMSRRSGTLTWWQNSEGDGLDWAEHAIDAAYGDGVALVVADLDGNGAPDLVTASKEGSAIHWFRNTAKDIPDCDPDIENCDGEPTEVMSTATPELTQSPVVTPTSGQSTPEPTPILGTASPVPTTETPDNTTITPVEASSTQGSGTPGVTSDAGTETPGQGTAAVTETPAQATDTTGEETATPEEASPSGEEGTPTASPGVTQPGTTDGITNAPTNDESSSPEQDTATQGSVTPTIVDTPVNPGTDEPMVTQAPTTTDSSTSGDGSDSGCDCAVSPGASRGPGAMGFALALLFLWPLRRLGKGGGLPRKLLSFKALLLLPLMVNASFAQADIVVNEVLARPVDGDDWVELFNTGDVAVDLSAWSLRDASDGQAHPDHVYEFPELVLESGAYLLVYSSEENGFDFGLGGEDGVFLFDDLGELVDSTFWLDGQAPEGGSWARFENGTGPFQTTFMPSPGATNVIEAESDEEPSDYLFDGELRTYALDIEDEDWEWLNKNQTLEEYVLGDLTFEGEVIENVGVRYKGSTGSLFGCFDDEGNLVCDKLAMKISVHKFEPGRRFLGLKKLQFHAMVNDPSKVREQIAYGLYRDFGVEAPRTNYGRIVVNDEVLGLYSLIEHIDEIFNEYHFADGGGGLLYKEVWPLYTDEQSYLNALESDIDENTDVSPMVEFAQDIQAADDRSAVDMLNKWQDVDHQMRYLAVDRAIENQDGIMGWWCFGPYCGNHNFFWYQGVDGDKIRLIPWDLDHSMSAEPWTSDIEDWPQWYEKTLTCRPMSLWGPIGFLPPACDDLIYYWGNATWDQYYEVSNLLLEELFTIEVLHASIDQNAAKIDPFIQEDPDIDHGEWLQEIEMFKEDIYVLHQNFVESLNR